MKSILAILLSFLLISCGKYECVKSSAPEMEGDWVHLSQNNGFHFIHIQDNGRGYMYGINEHGNNQDTQRRGWYIKDDVLYYSRYNNKYEEDKFIIDSYPTEASQEIYTADDPAGIIAICILTSFASITVSTLASLFERLVQYVIDMKTENELSI